MSKALREALKSKFGSPKEALKALGLDEKLLDDPKGKDDAEEGEEVEETATAEEEAAANLISAAREFLKEKLSDEDMEAYDSICSKGMDSEEDDDDKKKGAKDDKDNDKVSKGAMDAAIKQAVKLASKQAHDAAMVTHRKMREAEEAVRPYVGKLAMAHDSADAIYRTALTTLGVDVKGIDPSAFPALLKLVPLPGSQKPVKEVVTMDAALSKGFSELFPGSKPVRTV